MPEGPDLIQMRNFYENSTGRKLYNELLAISNHNTTCQDEVNQ